MAAKLDIEYIEIRNFLSYGDYTTRLDVANLGPVLILGSTDAEEGGSNGAGKSSLLTAFIWCLFGRTITNPSPGDKIVNWFTQKNCHVKIKTADGWEIIRARNFDGHNELILRKNGDDETQSTNTNAQKKINELFGLDYGIFTSSVFCGQFGKSFLEMSPAKRKEAVERLLGLDRLNSYADIAKNQFKQIESKQEITRTKIKMFETDTQRQSQSLDETKILCDKFENERTTKLDIISKKIQEIEIDLDKIKLPNIEELKSKWKIADVILNKISKQQNEIEENHLKIKLLSHDILRIDRDQKSLICAGLYSVPNIDDLKEKHQVADQAEVKISKIDQAMITVLGQVHNASQDIERLRQQILNWENKSNTDCESCGQKIDENHIKTQIESAKKDLDKAILVKNNYQNVADKLKNGKKNLQEVKRPAMSVEEALRLKDLNESLEGKTRILQKEQQALELQLKMIQFKNDKLKLIVDRTIKKLDEIKPEITLQDISRVETMKKSLIHRKNDLMERRSELISEDNPYNNIISKLLQTIDSLEKDIVSYKDEIEEFNVLFSHYKYIYRSYSDRRKIKSWLLSELIPFLNDRVQYYLDLLDIEMQIKFNSVLNAETDKWGYEFCSGGERKRIDLAIMFGLYDLYMSIYGKQCNIMVLDEVDSRLDKKGVEAFTEIVNDICTNDERPRPSTVFVISHKQELQSMFPSQITIKKVGNFSSIDQTVFSG